MVSGQIVNVHDSVDGSELAADAAAAATTITVVDLLDFNEDPEGGQLTIDDGTNSETLTYTVPDGSTGLINLGSALVNSYLTGTRVEVYPQVVERWADIVEPDGEEPLRCLVPHQLRPLIALGSRNLDDATAEQVNAEYEDGDLVITDVLGRTPIYDEIDLIAQDTGTSFEARDPVRWLRHSDRGLSGEVYVIESGGVNAITAWAVADISGVGRATLTTETANSGTIAAVVCQVDDGGPAVLQRIYVELAGVTLDLLRGDGTTDFLVDDAWATWSPTFTGWSGDPAGGVYRYRQIGSTVIAVIRQPNNGTSNSANLSMTLPVTAATITGAQWEAAASGTDNGTALTTPARAAIASGGTTITFGKDYSATAGGWTAAGGKRIAECTIIYEV